jgi:hypothetical protein
MTQRRRRGTTIVNFRQILATAHADGCKVRLFAPGYHAMTGLI